MMWMIVALLAIAIGTTIFYVFSGQRHRRLSPRDLANRLLRNPERSLIDLPRALAELRPAEVSTFLEQTEAELALAGELRVRREFLSRWKDVVERPTLERMKALHVFLNRDAPAEFRQALVWDGRCRTAVECLQYLGRLAQYFEGESGNKVPRTISSDQLKKYHAAAMDRLHGTDKAIVKEWSALLRPFVQLMDARKGKPRSRGKKNQRSGNRKAQKKRETKAKEALRKAVAVEKRVPTLMPLQAVAREVYFRWIGGDSQDEDGLGGGR